MSTLPDSLRNDVRSLGALLGEILKEQAGTSLFERVEQVRSWPNVHVLVMNEHSRLWPKPWVSCQSGEHYRWPAPSHCSSP